MEVMRSLRFADKSKEDSVTFRKVTAFQLTRMRLLFPLQLGIIHHITVVMQHAAHICVFVN